MQGLSGRGFERRFVGNCHCGGVMLTLLLILGLASPASAAVKKYTNRTLFEAAFTGLTLEDFEEADVAYGEWAVIPNVLNSSTNNAVFQTGDIAPGVEFIINTQTINNYDNLFVSGGGVTNLPFPSKYIGYSISTTSAPEITIKFAGGVHQVGFDLYPRLISYYTYKVRLFGAGNTSIGLLNLPATETNISFFGVDSTTLIERVEISGGGYYRNGGDFFGVDNVVFSAVIPEASTLALLPLGGTLALSISWIVRRRRKIGR